MSETSICSCQFGGDNLRTIGGNFVKFGKEISHECIYKLCVKHFIGTLKNPAMRNFQLCDRLTWAKINFL